MSEDEEKVVSLANARGKEKSKEKEIKENNIHEFKYGRK